MKNEENKCLVCFSGGFDSTSCLLLALRKFDKVATIGFNYGQQNSVELKVRQEILKKIREQYPEFDKKLEPDFELDVSSFADVASSSLTKKKDVVADVKGLATDYVPMRNLMFLSCAGARAFCIGAKTIFVGTCLADYEEYPDCRQQTLDAMQNALRLGSDYDVSITAPLISKSKADTWRMLEEIGGEELIQFIAMNTHSCNKNDRTNLHEWGYGCGECESCKVRMNGYENFKSGRK